MNAHKYAALFPMASEDELNEMAEDIKQRGLLNKIILLDDKILDGRNRFEACKRADIEPKYCEYTGHDPLGDVVSWNLKRRHLSPTQKATLGVEIEPLYAAEAEKRLHLAKGRGVKGEELFPQVKSRDPQSRDQAAAMVGVSGKSVSDAKAIKEKSPELFEKMKTGETTINEAKKELRKKKQIEIEKTYKKASIDKKQTWIITGDQSVLKCDALITDPPYGILDESWEPKELEKFTKHWLKKWNECDADFILSFWSQRNLFIGKKWFDESLTNYKFQQLLVWVYKNNKSPQSRMGFKQIWEPIFFFRKTGSKKEIGINAGDWGDDKHDMDAHIAAVPQSNFNDVEMKQHPAQKPISTMRWLVSATTRPGDLVVDPFCGSGTTGIACIQLDRKFHGIETDKSYRELSERLINTYGRFQ
jgi:DNA modification methylase